MKNENVTAINENVVNDLINDFDRYLSEHKLDMEPSFIRYSKGGKLIIDLDDLNATNVDNDESMFLKLLNALKDNY